MVFSSPIFLFFFLPAAYLVYLALPGERGRNRWLALSSLVFFAFGQLVYVPLLLGSVTANYLFGLWLQNPNNIHRRAAVSAAVAVNLLALGIFKYLDFLLDTVNTLTGRNLPLVGLALPIGISFYTFQGLSYVIDVYRRPKTGTRSFWKLLLYISFFPQLIAGPIVIYRDVSPQIDHRERTPELTLSGLRRLIAGLGKKLLLADTAAAVADAVFGMAPVSLDWRLAWLGAVCYTLQIYFDFSGYSDMALGLGRLFGFRFPENFNLPYTARSVRMFWRRWHISLSTWFRDYLYIPLGGNRRSPRRTAFNKLIVFFLTGLWHGANWTFVLWGLWHGLFSVLEDRNIIPRRLRSSPAGHVYTMLVVTLGFTLFRAESVGKAMGVFAAMFGSFPVTASNTLLLRSLLDRRTVCLLALALVLAAGLPGYIAQRLNRGSAGGEPASAAVPALSTGFVGGGLPLSMGTAVLYALVFVCSVLHMVSTSYSPFIYFQF